MWSLAPGEDRADATGIVARPRLLRALEQSVRCPLTVIRAPSGYGKTVAAESFLSQTPLVGVRVTLDARDDRHRAWRRVLAHLDNAGIGPGFDTTLGMLTRSGPDEAGLLDLLTEAGHLGETTVVVLDDLHRVTDPLIFDQLAFLVDRLPPRLRLVAISQARLPLPLARWRTQSRLVEIEEDELRFTEGETAALLDMLGIAGTDPEDTAPLAERAEGWATGIMLLAYSYLAGRSGASTANPPNWHDLALDERAAGALSARLVRPQPADIQAFLLATSVARKFDADLCRELVEREDAGRLLDAVDESGLFLVPLDDDRRWYRYRRLFAELMRRELDHRHPGLAFDLHRRAARWCQEQGDIRETLGHLVAAGDIDSAFALAGEGPYRRWRTDTYTGVDWHAVFPDNWVEGDPARMLYFATLLGRTGWLKEAKTWMDRAEAALASWPVDDLRHGLMAAAQSLWYGVHLDARATLDHGEQALAILGDAPAQQLVRQRVLVAMASAHLTRGELDEAERLCAALDRSATDLEVLHELVVPALRARLAFAGGDLVRADHQGRYVLSVARRMGLGEHLGLRDANLAMGGVAGERGQWAEAEEHIGMAIAMGDGVGWPVVAADGRIFLARVRAAHRGPEAGLEVLAEARRSIEGMPAGPDLRHVLNRLRARLQIRAGQVDEARELLAAVPPGTEQALVQVRLAVAEGRPADATATLAQVEPTTLRQRILVHLLAARAAAYRGDAGERDRQLVAAARLGRPEGYAATFVDEAPELVRRLAELAEDHNALGPVLAAIDGMAGSNGALTEPLTQREQAVLRHLASDLTQRDIATELDISANTMKSHVRGLYRKLGVSSRRGAVEAARHAGLLRGS